MSGGDWTWKLKGFRSFVPGSKVPRGASFTFSCTDLICDFDATASNDEDGTISSYDWDLGDGTTDSGVTVSHTYGAAGTYTVILTDDTGSTGSDSKEVTVGETGQSIMQVADVSVSLVVKGDRARGTAVVTILDENGDPVADATVTGDWLQNGTVVQSGQSTTTDGSGQATMGTRFSGVASGDVIEFCVTDVTHASLVYDPSSNMKTCGQSTVP